jgi:rod shape-determining protein MreD
VRRSAAIAIAGIASMLLQTAVFPVLLPASLAPNLLLVLVVYLGVHQFGAAGALGAFVLGYFLDTFSGTLLGLHAFAFTAVYLGVHHVARVLWTEGGVPAVLIVFVAACAYAVLVLALTSLAAVAGRVVWTHGLRHVLLDALVAAAVTPLVFGFLSWEQRVLRVGA